MYCVFVFIFFGLVAVVGSYYLYALHLDWTVFLPALTIGFLSIAVLNLNNMRDRLSDTRANKNTLAVFLGATKVKYYHYSLILGAFLASLLFFYLTNTFLWSAIAFVVFIPLGKHLIHVSKNEKPALLDPELNLKKWHWLLSSFRSYLLWVFCFKSFFNENL